MKLKSAISTLLMQLQLMIDELTDEQYSQPIKILSGASVSQHVRHVLEFYLELNKGYESLIIDYNKRTRNTAIEADRFLALLILRQIAEHLEKPDKLLVLNEDYGNILADPLRVFTNYQRELMYNLEHTVHHMALIRIGLEAICDLKLPESFGVAASTLAYRNTKSI